jgi:hypothetical protein
MKLAVFFVPLFFGLTLSQGLDKTSTAAATTTTTVAAETDPPSVNTCTETIYRQEVRDMSTADWESFVAAFKEMNQDGSLAKFVNWHKLAWTMFHLTSKFLPFHRAYILEFERELIARGAAYLPYWNSTIDSQDPPSSPLLTAEYFGANDGMYIIDGPFAREAPMSYKAAVGGGPIVRNYGNETGAFYAQSLIDSPHIMRFKFSDFSKRLEYGPHAIVHSIIGGKGGQLTTNTSPEDPLFWIHHCFMDLLWDAQQKKYGYKYEGNAYNENAQDTDMVGFVPWTRPVSEVLHSDDICVSYSKPEKPVPTSTDETVETEEVTETVETVETEGLPVMLPIRVPEIAENWFDGSGADLTFAEQLANETRVTVDKINAEVAEVESENTAAGFVVCVSVGLVAVSFALICI